MLQQTRVTVVVPYYERFLERFPRPDDLAAAEEEEVLALWSGLGYYSRARNMQKAAREITKTGMFPRDHASIRAMAGVGEYTAAAVASIAFGLPHAAVDGNVRRVISRIAGDPAPDTAAEAQALLDRRHPGRSNQALMELGALVCLPRDPQCGVCPVAKECAALRWGGQRELPPPRQKAEPVRKERTLLVIRREGRLLLAPSPRVTGFWELPEPFPGAVTGAAVGSFRHSITNSQYRFEVREGKLTAKGALPKGARWWHETELTEIPVSTATKKALRCL